MKNLFMPRTIIEVRDWWIKPKRCHNDKGGNFNINHYLKVLEAKNINTIINL